LLLSMSFREMVVRRGLASVFAVALGWGLHAQAWADVWKFVEANGVTHLSNQRPAKASELTFVSEPVSSSPVVPRGGRTPAIHGGRTAW